MTTAKQGTKHGGRRAGAGRPRKADALSVAVTVAITRATADAIDADRQRLRREVPEATVDRAGWVRAAIHEKLARLAG